MEIFMNAIETKKDGQAMIKQLRACQEHSMERAGIFIKGEGGYQSCSLHIDAIVEAIEIKSKLLPEG